MRPTRDELEAAWGRSIPDVIAPGLRVLFCGINPGLYSGATGRHFARPGNRFWRVLHRAGFTDRELSPFEGHELLGYGLGVTNLVNRTTRAAADLTAADLRRGAGVLKRKVARHRPAWLAVVGIGAYRTGFRRPDAGLGAQEHTLDSTRVWVLPNTSGLNANYQLPRLVEVFAELRAAASG